MPIPLRQPRSNKLPNLGNPRQRGNCAGRFSVASPRASTAPGFAAIVEHFTRFQVSRLVSLAILSNSGKWQFLTSFLLPLSFVLPILRRPHSSLRRDKI